jgi:DNA/RNA endonuclease YhcR with UshA esterase domain
VRLQASGADGAGISVKTLVMLLVSIFLWSSTAAAKCIPYTEADNRIGDQACVTGKVVKVAQSNSGTFFLNFCEKYQGCPFTVVVFPSSLKDVGDVRALEGKTIEIFGKITSWRGHAEIVLKDARQLKGESAKLPPVPKEYDVERKGKFSSTAPKPSKDKAPPQ